MISKWLKILGIEFTTDKNQHHLTPDKEYEIPTLEMNFLEVLIENKSRIEVLEYYQWHMESFLDMKAIKDYHEKFKDTAYVYTGYNHKKMMRESKTIYRVKYEDKIFDIIESSENCILLDPNLKEDQIKIEDSLDKKGNHTGSIVSTSKGCCVVFDLIESIWYKKHFKIFEMNESYKIISKANKRLITDLSLDKVYAWSKE